MAPPSSCYQLILSWFLSNMGAAMHFAPRVRGSRQTLKYVVEDMLSMQQQIIWMGQKPTKSVAVAFVVVVVVVVVVIVIVIVIVIVTVLMLLLQF